MERGKPRKHRGEGGQVLGRGARGAGGGGGGEGGGQFLGIWVGGLGCSYQMEYRSIPVAGWPSELAMGEALHLEAQPSPRGCIRPLSYGTTHCPYRKGVSRCRV